MKRKYHSPFYELEDAALGTAKLGMITALSSSVSAKTPAGSPSLSSSSSTIAGFVPIANTMIAGRMVLRHAKKLKRYRY